MNKTMLISLFMLLCGTIIQAQVKIGENGSPTKGALLDLNGTYKGGLLLPNVAITDLGTIPTGFTERGGADKAADLAGMIVWSTDPVNSGLYMWDGDNWQSLMCNEKVFPCTGPAPAPTAITIPAGPFANGETFEVSCTATEDGTTFYIWTAPTGLSITAGQGTKTIRVSGASGTFNKSAFTVFAVNQCAQSATKDGGTGQITVANALTNGAPPSTTVEIPTGGNTELDAGTITGGNCSSYSYQWQKLNGSVWEDIPSATSVKYRTDALTADAQYHRITTCGTETITSATITVTIKQVTEPSSVTATPPSICSGSPTTLSATGGSGSTFVWYTVDCGDTQVGTGTSLEISPTTTTTYWGRWESGSSSSTCEWVTVNVTPTVTPKVTISGNASVYVNTDITFTATPENGGTSPTYRWSVDGVEQSSNSSSFTTQWNSIGDHSITCVMTSNAACAIAANAVSDAFKATVVKYDNTACGCEALINSHAEASLLRQRQWSPGSYCSSTQGTKTCSSMMSSGVWSIFYCTSGGNNQPNEGTSCDEPYIVGGTLRIWSSIR